MVDLVKSLREIQEDGVNLFVVVEAKIEISSGGQKLSFAAAFLSTKSMLEVIERRVQLKMIHYATVNDVFQKFRGD